MHLPHSLIDVSFVPCAIVSAGWNMVANASPLWSVCDLCSVIDKPPQQHNTQQHRENAEQTYFGTKGRIGQANE